jgi:hypothetical protein
MNHFFLIRSMTHKSLYARHLVFSLLFAIVVSPYCTAQDSLHQKTVASIAGDYSISFTDLQSFVFDFSIDKIYRKNLVEGYYKALEIMILNRSKVIDFFSRIVNEKKESFQSIRRTINEELVVKYYETQFYDRYINEQAIQKAYREFGREVVYQQIVLSKSKKSSNRRGESITLLAYQIKAQLDKGIDFEVIKKMYSNDIVASDSNNRTLEVNWGTSFLNALNYTIFLLPEGESRVLQGSQGIHIVQVTKIYNNDVPAFEKVKTEIHKTLKEVYSDLSLKQFDSTKKNLFDEKTVQWNRKGLKQLLQWFNTPNFFQKYYGDTLRKAISDGKNFVVLTYSKNKVDLKEFLRLIDDILIPGRYTSMKENDLKSFILEAVRTNIIVERASALNLEKEIVNSRTNNPIIRNDIVRLYNEKVIDTKIPPATPEALLQFYNQYRDSLFYQLAKINIYAIIDSNKDTVENLKRKLNQDIPFEKLRNVLSVKTFIMDREGHIKSYISTEKPFLGEAAFQLKLNEIAGPVNYYDTANIQHYALIKCIGRMEEKQLLFQDVKNTIQETYKNFYRELTYREANDILSKKYPVTIYRDVINQNLRSMGITPQ